MLDIETFDNLRGGNVVYKALAHPLAAIGLARLTARVNAAGLVAIYDPDGIAGPLLALCPGIDVEGIYVHDTLAVGQIRGGHVARPLTALAQAGVACVLVADFGPAARGGGGEPGCGKTAGPSGDQPESLSGGGEFRDQFRVFPG
jgi:hypothetical protein